MEKETRDKLDKLAEAKKIAQQVIGMGSDKANIASFWLSMVDILQDIFKDVVMMSSKISDIERKTDELYKTVFPEKE